MAEEGSDQDSPAESDVEDKSHTACPSNGVGYEIAASTPAQLPYGSGKKPAPGVGWAVRDQLLCLGAGCESFVSEMFFKPQLKIHA